MKLLRTAVISLAITSLSGCATIFNDRIQKVNIVTSNGEKADLIVNGNAITVPSVVDIERSENPLIITTFDKKCADKTVANSKVSTTFFFNILALPYSLFSSSTDYATEKMWQYEDKIEVSCTK